MKNWIFSKSTQKGLWENVKDGISRPIGSRGIPKTKVETDLLDTLYMGSDQYFCQMLLNRQIVSVSKSHNAALRIKTP